MDTHTDDLDVQNGMILIVIPFVSWGSMVERCVRACLGLNDCNYRICLVPSDAKSIPPQWHAAHNVEVITSHHHGISHKRNLAIDAHPDAAIYACLDSDAWPEPNWLVSARNAFSLSLDVWIAGGPNLSPPGLPPARQAVADALRSYMVSGPKVFTKERASSRDTIELPACNLLIRRTAVKAIGGFDEDMEVGEDSVLCHHVRTHKKRIHFKPDISVFHEPRRLWQPFFRQRFVSGYGIPPLIFRHWRTMGLRSVMTELLPSIALIYLSAGWLGALVLPFLGHIWLATWVAYLVLTGTEALRLGGNPRQFWMTWAAILIGNLAPGAGTCFRCCGLRLHIGDYYRNTD